VFLLDNPTFQREEPEANQLVERMADWYDADEPIVKLVAPWIKHFDIRRDGTTRQRWSHLLEELARRGKLRACVQAARDEHEGNAGVEFFDKLLARGKYGDEPDDHGAFDPWEYLHLFDRSTESDHLVIALDHLDGAPPPFCPIIIGILAEPADEPDLFHRHALASVLDPIIGSGASQDCEIVKWADASIPAEHEMKKLAMELLGKKLGELKNPQTFASDLGKRLAGRVTKLELTTAALSDDKMEGKLTRFLELWGDLGEQQRPPVLHVSVVRAGETHPTPAQSRIALQRAFAKAGGSTALVPIALAMCQLTHFGPWEKEVSERGRTFDKVKYEEFKRDFTEDFRLRRFRDRLMEQRVKGRIYI
jgi:hypothetical protein